MTKYVIHGGKPLFGEIDISGAKNAAVAIIPAALLVDGVCRIENIPQISDVTLILNILQELGAEKIVVGYPKNMNGSIGDRARASEEFKKILEERFPSIPVVLWDERLSTVAAEKVLIEADLQRKKRKKIIDMMAAVVILQNYLDSPRRN